MPRRALVWVTLLVLALHWLVLHGVPQAVDISRPRAKTHAFNTRSIAAAPPPAPVAMAAAEAPSPAARVPTPKPQPKPKPKAPHSARTKPPSEQLTDTPAQGLQAATPDGSVTASSTDLTGTTTQANDMGAIGDTAEETVKRPVNVSDAATQASLSPSAAPGSTDEAPDAEHAPPAPPASVASSPASAALAAAAPSTADAPPTSAGVDISAPGASPGQGASTVPPPVQLPAPTRLAFDVTGQAKKFNYSARAELLWQHDGSRYEARQEVSLFLMGSRSQKSVGQITSQGLAPEKFSDRARSEQAAHFDQAKGRVTFSANTPAAAVGPGAQDRLSLFIQLGALLAGDPARFVPGTQITLTAVSARSADRWTFTVEGPEALELPAGTTQTLKLQRLPRRDYDQKAELWVAPSLGYLPVRIKITQANGDFADLRLRSSSAP